MSSEAASKLELPLADLIYIDGEHSEAGVSADIENYYRFLSSGGVMCGDDYEYRSERGKGIVRSVHSFAEAHGLEVGSCTPLWWYIPVPKPDSWAEVSSDDAKVLNKMAVGRGDCVENNDIHGTFPVPAIHGKLEKGQR